MKTINHYYNHICGLEKALNVFYVFFYYHILLSINPGLDTWS